MTLYSNLLISLIILVTQLTSHLSAGNSLVWPVRSLSAGSINVAADSFSFPSRISPFSLPSFDGKGSSQDAESTVAQDTEAEAGLQEKARTDTALASQLPEIIGLFAISQGDFLAVTANGQVSVWSLDNNQQKVIFPAGQLISTCDFLKKGNLLAVAQDTQVFLYSIDERKQIAVSPRIGTKSSSLSFAPDGKSIVIGGEDGKVYRWVFEGSNQIRIERYIGHSAAITALAYHPYNRFFFSADSFGTISAWQTYDKDLFAGQYDKQKATTNFYAEDGQRIMTTAAENSTVLDMRLSADGQNLFTSLQDGRVEWRLVRGLKLIVSGRLNSGALYDIKLSPDGSKFASIARDGKLRIWAVRSLDPKTAINMKDPEILKYNDIKADSLGYFEMLKEIVLPDVRKLVFLNESSLVVGEQSGRLLEVKL